MGAKACLHAWEADCCLCNLMGLLKRKRVTRLWKLKIPNTKSSQRMGRAGTSLLLGIPFKVPVRILYWPIYGVAQG